MEIIMPADSPDSPENPTDAKVKARALAAERRAAMRLRARRIRQSVAALTASMFIFSGAYIGIQLANGKDPSLLASSGSGTSATLVASNTSPAVKTTASGAAATVATASTASIGTSTSAVSTGAGSTENASTAVTTSQS
jgi:hypothetical protein